ncbi:MAG TPA: hypothetical protein VIU11_21585 [Nakamurella sp.]
MRRTVRILIRLAVLLALGCAAAVATPGAAAAGGPTSVLLASPYSDSAAALYYTDEDYGRLQGLLGGPDLPAQATEAPPASAAGSPYVTATWLIHDVSVWRIDRIFLIGDDVWIVTEAPTGDAMPTGAGMYPGETGDAGAMWHRPTDPAALTALLTGFGLTPGAAAATVSQAAATAQATPIQSTASSTWLWGIGGLLAGLIVGLGVGTALVLAKTARRGQAGPSAEPMRMLPIT